MRSPWFVLEGAAQHLLLLVVAQCGVVHLAMVLTGDHGSQYMPSG
jgi:hypothetical protein